MGDLSDHFSAVEFACSCGCGYGTHPSDVTPALLDMLERIRRDTGKPLRITSGCRCDIHNKRVGGARDSEHTHGLAADIWAPSSIARLLLVQSAIECGCNRIGLGRTYVHIGVGEANPGMWGYSEVC